ncbi:MAG: helix-turn-helix transcriptional regulator [Planctomycetota bacterium]
MNASIDQPQDLGELIREERKRQGLRQPDLAAAAGTSVRFIVEIERGKPTAQIGKVMDVLRQLGLRLSVDGLTDEGS